MDSRERYQAALDRMPADRLPFNYLAGREVTMSLMKHLGVRTEKELLDRLGCDFYFLSGRDISQNETILPFYSGPELHMTATERICPFGIRWRRGAESDKFSVDETIEGPFEKGATSKDILNHPWPRPQWFHFEEQLEECEENRDKVRIGGLWSGIFGDSYRMYGFEHFLLDVLMNPEVIKTLVDRMTGFYLEMNDRLFRTMGDKMDIFFMGNDFGTQNGLLMDKSVWAELFCENIKSLVDLAHSYDHRVMVHSCGAISELIPELVEMDVDILDPVQTGAAGMEPEKLSGEFGDHIVFHGGIDTQQILPSSDPETVESHVVHNISTFGSKGGYIVAPSNNIPPGTPVENIMAIYRSSGIVETNKPE